MSRERKKDERRQLIADTARRLFAERGFERVRVAEVARAAGVSEGTVFNYFPAKEDLFYGDMEAFETVFLDAVRRRPSGESVLVAFRRFVLESTSRLAAEEVADVVASAARVIGASPALQRRERELFARYTNALAALIAGETGARAYDIEPWTVANALMGVQRSLLAQIRAQALDNRRGPSLAAEAEAQVTRAFARLENGFGGYALK